MLALAFTSYSKYKSEVRYSTTDFPHISPSQNQPVIYPLCIPFYQISKGTSCQFEKAHEISNYKVGLNIRASWNISTHRGKHFRTVFPVVFTNVNYFPTESQQIIFALLIPYSGDFPALYSFYSLSRGSIGSIALIQMGMDPIAFLYISLHLSLFEFVVGVSTPLSDISSNIPSNTLTQCIFQEDSYISSYKCKLITLVLKQEQIVSNNKRFVIFVPTITSVCVSVM